MQVKVTSEVATEFEIHKFVTEASTLRLPPGHFPLTLDTDLGNGQPFQKQGTVDGVVIYRQQLGCIVLHVLND